VSALAVTACGDGPGSSSAGRAGRPLPADPGGPAVAEQCRRSVEAHPIESPRLVAELAAICGRIRNGTPLEIRIAIHEVCLKIVESTVPPGAGRDQADAACEQAGG
jgi:hypothetical protein